MDGLMALYGAEGKLDLISGGYQNTVYQFEIGEAAYIMRVSEADRRTKEQIEDEVNWLHFLKDNDIQVATPIKNVHQTYVEGSQKSFVTAFQKAIGKEVDVYNKSIWNETLFEKWGRLIGKLHRLSSEKPFALANRPEWTNDHSDLLWLGKGLESKEMRDVYKGLLDKLRGFEKKNTTFGLIHNDLHQGNFFYDGETIVLFDFDDCAYHWYAYDIAVSFYHAYWQGTSADPDAKNFGVDFMKAFMDGYKKEQTIDKDILLQIPIFLKIRELFLYVLFMKKWDLNKLEGWQDFTIQNLRESILKEKPHSDIDFLQFL
ncbi:phosphotransferase [Bacillus tianshenii]|uniref:phosphotransferase enzyme family protein n=1 Tax=Sutcliffiella tianshenii TaxID=1463404 RepID=UPI001CD30884|nr:phosphotransferase [Bacillus tianshenii]MCA1318578.1 phosphotransferase [Bacillus tianshenii]